MLYIFLMPPIYIARTSTKSNSNPKFSDMLKQTLSLLAAMARALKSRASAAKTRLIIFKLLRDKNALLGSFPRKTSEIDCEERRDDDDDDGKVLLMLRDVVNGAPTDRIEEKHDDVVDGLMMSNGGEGGSGFEEGIDQAADVFIRKFHRQMMIQKQDSIKRYQEMLARGL